MRQAILRVRPDDGDATGFGAVHAMLTEAGLVDLEMLSCDVTGGVLRVTVEAELDETRLGDVDLVRWVERAGERNGRPTYLLEVGEPNLLVSEDGPLADLVPGETLAVDGDAFRFDLAGPQSAISDAVETFDRAGLSVSLETLRDYDPSDRPVDALTRRQREVLETAYDLGYYDVPRNATTDTVAAELDLDSSTVAEHLQRAERNLLGAVLDRAV